jgi:hypothetical protein
MSLFDEVTAGSKSVNELYQIVTDRLGPKATLYLAASSPVPYTVDSLFADQDMNAELFSACTENFDGAQLAQKARHLDQTVSTVLVRLTNQFKITPPKEMIIQLTSQMETEDGAWWRKQLLDS